MFKSKLGCRRISKMHLCMSIKAIALNLTHIFENILHAMQNVLHITWSCIYFVLLFVWWSCLFQHNFGMKTDISPKDSCQKIFNIQKKGKCMMSCLAALDVHYMFSYNEDQETCMCCKDLSGSDVISPEWETFVPREFNFGSQ